MSPAARRLVRSALLWLVAALAAGLVAAAAPVVGVPALSAARPVFIHLLVVGWLTQLIFGVAWWMFPRPRGPVSDAPATITHVALNVGLALRVVAEPLVRLGHVSPWHAVLVVSAVAQAGAGLVFVASLWPRVRGR